MGLPVIESIFGKEGIIYASIFAQNFNKEQDFSALSVFLNTLVSIITIPLILKIIT